jgi:hypothetical protein
MQVPLPFISSLGAWQDRHALDPNLSQVLHESWQNEQIPFILSDSKVPSSHFSTHLKSGVSLNPFLQPRHSSAPGPLHSIQVPWQVKQGVLISLGKLPEGQGSPQELSFLNIFPG